MDLGLRGKVTVVTASSRGIGKGIARVMLQEGARVMLFARNADELKATASELSRETGGDVAYVQGDLTNRDDVMRLIDETRRVMGRLSTVGGFATGCFSTVSLGPLTAAAPSLSPGVPSHYGSRDPRVTVKGVGVRFINLLRDIPPWIT
jgi:NAD(P)-dependent dehydrogenase (short-subunit alcohol dehydrogenase family)